MSLHDLLRGFFGFRGHGGGGGGGGSRGPEGFGGSFFGGPCRDNEEDDRFGSSGLLADDDDDNDDSFPPGWGGGNRRNFGFGLRVGPDGQFRFHENLGFGNILHEMEQLFQNIDSMVVQPPHRFDLPLLPGPDDPPRPKEGQSLRDYMLKNPDDPHAGPRSPSRGEDPGRGGGHGGDSRPPEDSSPPGNRGSFDGLPAHPSSPFDLFDFFRRGFFQPPTHHPTLREDQDLDSRVKSEGLDSLLRQLPPNSSPEPRSSLIPGHAPGVHSFFSSVSVSTVTMPDGTVEERKTVVGSDGKKRTVFRRFDPRTGREMEQREEVVEPGPLRR